MFVHKDEKQKDGFELQSYVSKNEDGSLTQKKYLNYSENIDSDAEIEEFVIDTTNLDQENIQSIIWSIVTKMWEELELEEFKKFEDEKITIQSIDQELMALEDKILQDNAPSGFFSRIGEMFWRDTKTGFFWTIASLVSAFGTNSQIDESNTWQWHIAVNTGKSRFEEKFPDFNNILELFTGKEKDSDEDMPPVV